MKNFPCYIMNILFEALERLTWKSRVQYLLMVTCLFIPSDEILHCLKKLTFCDAILAFIVIVQHVDFSVAVPFDFLFFLTLLKWNRKTVP